MADQHDEPTIDDMVDSLLADIPDNITSLADFCDMETPNPLPSSDSLPLMPEIEGSHQVSTTSGEDISMSINPENAIGNSMVMNPGYGSIGGQSNYPADKRIPNISCNTVPQLDQHYHHFSAQFVESTNNYQQYQGQQHQTNQSSSFAGTSQESWISDDHQRAFELEMQLRSQMRQMDMQNQFPQSQNVNLAHPMTSQNDPYHVFQGLPQGLYDSPFQVNMANSSDWAEQAFQEIQTFRNMHITEVVTLYNLACEMRSQAQNSDMVKRCEIAFAISDKTQQFLNMSKPAVLHCGEDNIFRGMKCLCWSLVQIGEMLPYLQQHSRLHHHPASNEEVVLNSSDASMGRITPNSFMTSSENNQSSEQNVTNLSNLDNVVNF